MNLSEFRKQTNLLSDCFRTQYAACENYNDLVCWLSSAMTRLACVRVMKCESASSIDVDYHKATIAYADSLLNGLEEYLSPTLPPIESVTEEMPVKYSNHVNKTILFGNIGHSVNMNHTKSGRCVVNFSVATNETWRNRETGAIEKNTEWHSVVAWDKNAELITAKAKIGSLVGIEGKRTTRKWTDGKGVKRTAVKIVVDSINFY